VRVEVPYRAGILVQPAIPIIRLLIVWTWVGALRFPDDPSCAFAPFHDPGRTNGPSPMMVPLVLPLPSRGQRLQRDMMSGLPWGLSACCLRFMRDVAMPMQDSLPAGWLTFAERELNPLGRDERFPSCYISSPFLDLS
jgi:hypothetical protein